MVHINHFHELVIIFCTFPLWQGISTACAVTALYTLARRVPLPARATLAANCMLAMVGVQVSKTIYSWFSSDVIES